MAEIPLIDIRPDHWEVVRDILSKHVPQYEVWAFGSRAKWTAKPYSDLDLAIVTDKPLPLAVSAELADEFSDSDLPYRVDVVDLFGVSESFRTIIERDKVPLAGTRGKNSGAIETRNFVKTLPPIDWISATVGDLVTLQRDIDLPDAERIQGHIPIVGSFGITGRHHVPACKGPGVCVGRSGASIGALTYVDEDYWPLNTCLYVKDFHGNNPRFAYYFLKTVDFVALNSGSAQPSLNRNFVHPVPARFPKPKEQTAIASLLGALDDKIDLNRRMNETLEAMARAIFKDWFVDFGPVRAKAEGRPPYLAPELWSLFPNALDDEDKPVGWKIATLGEHVLNFDAKRVPVSGAERAKRKGPYPYYGAASIMDCIDDFLFDGIYLLVGEDGSVVRQNGLAITQYAWGKIWVNNHAHVLQGKHPISTEHLYLYFD
ncbi:MAG: restriction endonuclease subunit S, partial [Rhodospirillaceae bacterium]